MPFVNVMVTKDNVSAEQKRAIIAGVTELLQRELGKNPATTHVVIPEVDTDNWGIGGMPCLEYRKTLQT